MPVWYMVVYTSTSQSYRYIPVYTGIYCDVRNRLVLSRWWRFQMYYNRIPVLVHTKYILLLCFSTDMYEYILGMYCYEHFQSRVISSRVSGFQMKRISAAGSGRPNSKDMSYVCHMSGICSAVIPVICQIYLVYIISGNMTVTPYT